MITTGAINIRNIWKIVTASQMQELDRRTIDSGIPGEELMHTAGDGVADAEIRSVGERLHDELAARGIDVLLDDRDHRAGVKFKDADLLGMPDLFHYLLGGVRRTEFTFATTTQRSRTWPRA